MEMKINGNVRELKFGIGFIRKLDQVYQLEMEGIQFGAGIMMAEAQLHQFNPATLADVIRCAATGNPSRKQVDEAVEEYAEENNGLGDLFDEIIEAMGKSPVVKDTAERMTNVQQ